MEARRTGYGVAALAVAASLGLHTAVVLVAVRQVGPAAGTPPRPPVILSLAGASLARVAAAEPRAAEVVARPADVPPSPAASPAVIPPPPLEPALPPPAVEMQPAAVAGPAPVRPEAADIPIEPASAPPSAEVAAVEPRGMIVAAASAPPQSIAEAVPPAILEASPGAPAPADRLAVAEAVAMPAADPPQPLGTAEPAAGEIRAVREAAAAVPVAPRGDEAASPGPESIPAETRATNSSVVLPVTDAPTPARAAEVASVEIAPARDAPPAAPAVRASADEVVASREAPAVSIERIRGFVDRYDGGPCFFASVTGTPPTGADIETFSASVDQVMAFHDAFMGQLGVEPDVIGQRVWSAQCPAVEFLRETRPSDRNPLTLELDRHSLRNDDTVSGKIATSGARRLDLYVVSETGAVQDLSWTLRQHGNVATFTAVMRHDGGEGPYPEMIVVAARTPSTSLGPAPEKAGSLKAALLGASSADASTVTAAALLLIRR